MWASKQYCVLKLSQEHMQKKQQPESTMLVQIWPTSSFCSNCGKCCGRWGNISLPLVEHKVSLTSHHEPEPYVRTTATNADHDATAETPTAATATTAPGADKDGDDPNDEHEYLNTETDNNIESKKSHSYDIYKQCPKQLLNAKI